MSKQTKLYHVRIISDKKTSSSLYMQTLFSSLLTPDSCLLTPPSLFITIQYDCFFKQIEKLSHQSCFLLIAWEQPIKLLQLKSKKTSIPILQLTGLDTASVREMLKNYDLIEI
ncbi:MAG: hypothetical protein F6K48_13820 [Okeania sp. SIO3H1]|uniref:hypothetical protein n=1 Tax=Okeania sp. SIO1I7 TaxID=2607772 RepID=UPI0013CDB069|nr:hypothetical protein [Okeania sp. SIO1I7]NEN89925.1 hypothetical protein [Okeania sp. SIO3H1]NET26426.1 hypothetical protein [Okeania sp. SIO1I7]